jgi:sarcosine oxidase
VVPALAKAFKRSHDRSMRYDVAVVGLGGMGSAILAHCAGRGSAIGLEQFERNHQFGSSSGKSRLIRKAYFEDPAYVPLLLRAYEMWRDLEQQTRQDLLRITGLLMVGAESSEIINGARRAAQEHHLLLEVLNAGELRVRYPLLRLLEREVGVFEPDGGVLNPERATEAHLQLAQRNGAEMRFGAQISGWEANGDGVVVRCSDQTVVQSRRLVLSLGPWFKETLEALGLPIRVQRNIQAWFKPGSDALAAGRFPPFLIDRPGLPAPLYGFPDFGDGVKAAFHAHGELTDAPHLKREIDLARDIEPIAHALEGWMPGAIGRFLEARACPYTLTPDGHFVVDHHPRNPGVVLCGGFSGHGFKFAPVIGEICADLAFAGTSRHDIDFLSLRRFG